MGHDKSLRWSSGDSAKIFGDGKPAIRYFTPIVIPDRDGESRTTKNRHHR
jgi:hypothetical protein